MGISLPLDQMTVIEKLAAMELIWEDICRNQENIPTFSWHERILQEREHKISQGQSTFLDLNEAKERIRNTVQ